MTSKRQARNWLSVFPRGLPFSETSASVSSPSQTKKVFSAEAFFRFGENLAVFPVALGHPLHPQLVIGKERIGDAAERQQVGMRAARHGCRQPFGRRAGGFSARRQAGEDFYFCMELAKTGAIREIQKTMVFPSARISRRVPFGTGKRMAEATLDGRKPPLSYDFRVFVCLREFLTAVSTYTDEGAPRIFAELTNHSTREFLESRGFPNIWGRFRRQYKTEDAMLTAFHRWFDGFVTLKYIHRLTEKEWPRRSLEEIYQTDCYRSSIT